MKGFRFLLLLTVFGASAAYAQPVPTQVQNGVPGGPPVNAGAGLPAGTPQKGKVGNQAALPVAPPLPTIDLTPYKSDLDKIAEHNRQIELERRKRVMFEERAKAAEEEAKFYDAQRKLQIAQKALEAERLGISDEESRNSVPSSPPPVVNPLVSTPMANGPVAGPSTPATAPTLDVPALAGVQQPQGPINLFAAPKPAEVVPTPPSQEPSVMPEPMVEKPVEEKKPEPKVAVAKEPDPLPVVSLIAGVGDNMRANVLVPRFGELTNVRVGTMIPGGYLVEMINIDRVIVSKDKKLLTLPLGDQVVR